MFSGPRAPSSVTDWEKNKNNTIKWGDFPDGPVVKTAANAGSSGSISGQGIIFYMSN